MLIFFSGFLFLPTAKKIIAFDKLPEEEQEKVKAIVYIMDQFSVSLEGYHELTQVDKYLPKKHLIEGCTKKEDRKWDVSRTPGKSHGAEIERKQEEFVSKNEIS